MYGKLNLVETIPILTKQKAKVKEETGILYKRCGFRYNGKQK